MGTNYYHKDHCDHCDHTKRLHIGKSSAGWVFALRIHPDQNINTLDDWKKVFEKGRVVDEYGTEISTEEMLRVITERSWGERMLTQKDLDRNHAIQGPSKLLRSKIGDYCAGHGEGTWDYHVGEFS